MNSKAGFFCSTPPNKFEGYGFPAKTFDFQSEVLREIGYLRQNMVK